MTDENPWSGWEPTVEAAPDDVLVSTLLARTEQLEQAQRWAVALEQRIDEIRQVLRGQGCRPQNEFACRGCVALVALEAELAVAE
jgi:hypothetical protein